MPTSFASSGFLYRDILFKVQYLAALNRCQIVAKVVVCSQLGGSPYTNMWTALECTIEYVGRFTVCEDGMGAGSLEACQPWVPAPGCPMGGGVANRGSASTYQTPPSTSQVHSSATTPCLRYTVQLPPPGSGTQFSYHPLAQVHSSVTTPWLKVHSSATTPWLRYRVQLPPPGSGTQLS